MIEVSCTSCGREYTLADRWAGRTFKCVVCSAPVTVPEDEQAKTDQVKPKSTPDPAGVDWSLIVGSLGPDEAAARQAQLKSAAEARAAALDRSNAGQGEFDPTTRLAPEVPNAAPRPVILPDVPLPDMSDTNASRRRGGSFFSLSPLNRSIQTKYIDDSLEQSGIVLALAVIGHLTGIVVSAVLLQRMLAEMPGIQGAGMIWALFFVRILLQLLIGVPLLCMGIHVAGLILRFRPGPSILRAYAVTGAPQFVGLFALMLGPEAMLPVTVVSLVMGPVMVWVLFPLDPLRFLATLVIAPVAAVAVMLPVALILVLLVSLTGVPVPGVPGFGDRADSQRVATGDGPDASSHGGRDPFSSLRDPGPPPTQRRRPEKLTTVDDAIAVLHDPAYEDGYYREALDIVQRSRSDQFTRDQTARLIPLLEQRCNDPVATIAQRALEALIQVDRVRGLDRLVAAIRSAPAGDYSARRDLDRLYQLDPERALPLLVVRLESASLTERADATERLARMKYAPALPLIASRFAEDRIRVGAALKQYGVDAEPHLWPYLTHESSFVRESAVELLGEVGTTQSLERLRPLLEDSSSSLARAAGQAIGKIQPGAFDSVDEAMLRLRSLSSTDQLAAARLLLTVEPDDRRGQVAMELERVLANGLFTEDAPLVGALAKWADDATVVRLLQHIDEEADSARQRRAAIRVLGIIGDARAATPISRWLVLEGDVAAEALIGIGPGAEPAAIEGLRARNEQGVLAAIRVLREVGGRASLAKLYQFARRHSSPTVRAAADDAHGVVMERVRAGNPND